MLTQPQPVRLCCAHVLSFDSLVYTYEARNCHDLELDSIWNFVVMMDLVWDAGILCH